MTPARMEIFRPDLGKWATVGELRPGDPPGSFSDNKPNRRDIYLFGCLPDDSATEIHRSKAGADVEFGKNGEIRVVNPLGLEPIAKLSKGESHEMEIRTDRGTQARIRIKHV